MPKTRDAAKQLAGYTIQKQERSRFGEVLDLLAELVCLTVYRSGT